MMDIKSSFTKTNIVLIGFMGSGKSSIGKILAKEISYHFIDSDMEISKVTRLSISQIFDLYGERYFRELEKNFILKYKNTNCNIISTGGGMPIFNNVKAMGAVFFLEADFEILYQRIYNTNTRPLFKDKNKAHDLFIQRQERYKQVSNYIINANQSIQKVIEDILKILNPSSDT